MLSRVTASVKRVTWKQCCLPSKLVVLSSRCFATTAPNMIPLRFKEEKSGKTIEVQAAVGKTLLDVCLDNNIDVEGACGGEMACSTCHLVLTKKLFDQLPEMEEEELDMLDLAMDVTETSRLGCQCKVDEKYRDELFVVPADSNSMLSS